MKQIFEDVRVILRDALQLGARADQLTADSALLGSVPEFDSMAVVSVVTAIERRFAISIHDDEINADTFATVGAVVAFVNKKLSEPRTTRE